MGLKNGKYIVESEGSLQSGNNTLPSLTSNSNESMASERSRKDEAASLPKLISQDLLEDTSSSKITNTTLIWLDTELNNRPSNIDTQTKLKNIINYLRTFDEVDACEQYIERLGDMDNTNTIHEEKVLVIISTKLALTIIPHFHDLPQVKYIYIYGKSKINAKVSQQLLTKYTKIKGIFYTSQSLLARITQDQN